MEERINHRQAGYAHIDEIFGPFPALVEDTEGPAVADFPRWVLPFLAAQVAEDAKKCPETVTVDLLPDGRVVERAPTAFLPEEGYEDRFVDRNPDGTYTVGPDWWWYSTNARTALRIHVRALIRPGARHRRFRALIAAHAAITMTANGLMAARERLTNRPMAR